jgi:hypothetical protein
MLGRAFETVDEVHGAVGDFVARYNAEWRVEKIGFLTPREARSGFGGRQAASYNLVSKKLGTVHIDRALLGLRQQRNHLTSL